MGKVQHRSGKPVRFLDATANVAYLRTENFDGVFASRTCLLNQVPGNDPLASPAGEILLPFPPSSFSFQPATKHVPARPQVWSALSACV